MIGNTDMWITSAGECSHGHVDASGGERKGEGN
jgi:hypothetical protein